MAGGFFLFFSQVLVAQVDVSQISKPFKIGESVTYKITYNWGLIWVDAGEVTFSVEKAMHKDMEVFHFVGDGKTYPKYDWFYKVRDRYESYADQMSLRPYRFIRDVEEGKEYYHNQYLFDHEKDLAFSFFKKPKKEMLRDTIDFPPGVFDVLSMIYYARCLNWNSYAIDQEVPIKLILDGKVYDSYIRYLGKEMREVEGLGEISCIKFRPRLIEGTIFPGGEEMTVWVTDDKNRIPVYIKTPILIGNIRAILKTATGTKY